MKNVYEEKRFSCQNIYYCRDRELYFTLNFPGSPSKHFVIKGTKPAHWFSISQAVVPWFRLKDTSLFTLFLTLFSVHKNLCVKKINSSKTFLNNSYFTLAISISINKQLPSYSFENKKTISKINKSNKWSNSSTQNNQWRL